MPIMQGIMSLSLLEGWSFFNRCFFLLGVPS